MTERTGQSPAESGNRIKHLEAVSAKLTPTRRKIVQDLITKPWFQDTDPRLQLELATLPQEGKENHDGFLRDMANRPDEIGGVTVKKLDSLARGNFALIPKFGVKNSKGDEFTYEYVSWRYGPESGAKGIVFVEDAEKKLSHFIVLRGDKFATGGPAWDSVGGFADLNTGDSAGKQVTTMLGRIETEIKEELGAPEIKIKEVYDLGNILPDAGMTNNNPDLFAAIIDGSEAKKVSTDIHADNPDAFELRAGGVVIPIGQLPEVVKMNNDAFFLSAVSRSLAHGVIKWPDVDATPVPYRMAKAS